MSHCTSTIKYNSKLGEFNANVNSVFDSSVTFGTASQNENENIVS